MQLVESRPAANPNPFPQEIVGKYDNDHAIEDQILNHLPTSAPWHNLAPLCDVMGI